MRVPARLMYDLKGTKGLVSVSLLHDGWGRLEDCTYFRLVVCIEIGLRA
jgi:hypothetical protein